MKIVPVNFINNFTSLNKVSKNSAKAITKNNQTAIHDNKFADLVGRSQVQPFSFKGLRVVGKNPDIIKEEIMGVDTVKTTEYNKKTGEYTATTRNLDGNCKILEYYNPLTSTEQTVIHKDDGSRVETIQSGDSYTHTEFDKQNRIVYSFSKEGENYSHSARNDFENNRQIVSIYDNGYQENKVYNLTTGEEITSGDLIYEEKYDDERDCYVTTNLLTNKILKEEWKLPDGRTKIALEYFEEAPYGLGRKRTYCALTRAYDEEYYREDGSRELMIYSTDNDKIVEKVYYDTDGKTVIKDIEEEKNDKGDIEYIREFIPKTDKLVKETYLGAPYKEIRYFDTETKLKTVSETYCKNRSTGEEYVWSRTEYYDDAKTPKTTKLFHQTGIYRYKTFRNNGTLETSSEFNENHEISIFTKYRRDGETKEYDKFYDYENRKIHTVIYGDFGSALREFDDLMYSDFLLGQYYDA